MICCARRAVRLQNYTIAVNIYRLFIRLVLRKWACLRLRCVSGNGSLPREVEFRRGVRYFSSVSDILAVWPQRAPSQWSHDRSCFLLNYGLKCRFKCFFEIRSHWHSYDTRGHLFAGVWTGQGSVKFTCTEKLRWLGERWKHSRTLQRGIGFAIERRAISNLRRCVTFFSGMISDFIMKTF